MSLFGGGKNNRNVNFLAFDGLPTLPKGTHVNLSFKGDCLLFKDRIGVQPSVELPLNQLVDFAYLSEKEIHEIEKDKSVVGRAVVGTLVFGPLGTMIGGMSGMGTKKKTKKEYKFYFIINYVSSDSDEVKAITLERTPATVRLSAFEKALKERSGVERKKIKPRGDETISL